MPTDLIVGGLFCLLENYMLPFHKWLKQQQAKGVVLEQYEWYKKYGMYCLKWRRENDMH